MATIAPTPPFAANEAAPLEVVDDEAEAAAVPEPVEPADEDTELVAPLDAVGTETATTLPEPLDSVPLASVPVAAIGSEAADEGVVDTGDVASAELVALDARVNGIELGVALPVAERPAAEHSAVCSPIAAVRSAGVQLVDRHKPASAWN